MTNRTARLSVSVLSLALLASAGFFVWALSRERVPPKREPVKVQAEAPVDTAPSAVRELEGSPRQLGGVPSRLKDRPSVAMRVAPFDRDAFERDPTAYLSGTDPARCFQTAAATAATPPLRSKGPTRSKLSIGGSLALWVQGLPGAPVTFTTFDGGAFKENGSSSVTVRADGRGLAVANFVATPGSGGDVNIVAGSPMAVGVQRFVVRISL